MDIYGWRSPLELTLQKQKFEEGGHRAGFLRCANCVRTYRTPGGYPRHIGPSILNRRAIFPHRQNHHLKVGMMILAEIRGKKPTPGCKGG